MVRIIFGTAVGMALGFAVIFGNFGEMLIVALFGVIGYVIAKAVSGDINVSQYVQGHRSNR
jgi:hypothetical protein